MKNFPRKIRTKQEKHVEIRTKISEPSFPQFLLKQASHKILFALVKTIGNNHIQSINQHSMVEKSHYEPPEAPANSSVANVRLRAQLIGEETAGKLRDMLGQLEVRAGNWAIFPTLAGNKAEADELRTHALPPLR